MASGITHQQNAAFKFIERYIIEHDGTPPSYDEIADALNLKAKSGVSRLIAGLEARGFIKRHGAMARSIEIVKPTSRRRQFSLPDDLCTRLDRYSAAHGENAAAVVIGAVTLHLDSVEAKPMRSASHDH